ncbi:hypothetical protein L207DRAFT_94577 [Hyaloscypha variabilis F]|uniref:Zn(2)-C6 fungal-type domain-containing protein n=1 Tax=Hyaloscypha variabilis (strain UAMH 11265 / GT02V1 / F) TaxID=1149755 RepID=A0A2J6RB95_HYAVF|nr:hypothetical protein L207DRAFT_94577 [Hyaloscypha variabilis F]
MTARARTGCQPCRTRHLKCDQNTPKCGRCVASNRECTKGYPYRVYKSKFAEDQRWLKTTSDLTFIDETEGLSNSYESGSESDAPFAPSEGRPSVSAGSTSSSHVPRSTGSPSLTSIRLILDSDAVQTPRSQGNSSSLGALNPSVVGTPGHHSNPSKTPIFPHDIFAQLPSPNPSTGKAVAEEDALILAFDEFQNTIAPPPPSIYLDTPVWPLTDPSEAVLLRHFVQNLATWLDLCDPMQHFQVEVPRRAGICPILLNAIFALSARHLSHIGNYDSFASNRYHDECLKYLIPMLNNTATISDETLFAATIILRVLEEIDLPDSDLQGHMLGIQVFVGARDPYAIRGGLSEAAYWVGLRQEIYVATVKQKSVKINLDQCLVDRSVEPASDFEWANRAVVHYADVLNCCFGPEGVAFSRWMELKEYSEKWQEMKPSSFTPIFYRDADTRKGEVFPEIWYSHACHIIGVQHHKLGQILLAIFDPKIPRVGGSRSTAIKAMEEQIKADLRELCGIGLYNRWTPPGIFTASMGIAICGDRFNVRADQEALLDVLVKTEHDHARRTTAVQNQMKEAWGWMSED